ncbi:hypothetical protein SCP_0100700 [Sparassis crispa]|uniref:Uncharacterized protein n=1 Tax=Sparassis crispa TaxID=139825 RepID=A0A401G4U1_9APHY|nr:hypothetical protein SCP_0100700 [Sparassis crispa]GBE77198.1 hypothetical protein SCP_0100700 [Sparassis crispa]
MLAGAGGDPVPPTGSLPPTVFRHSPTHSEVSPTICSAPPVLETTMVRQYLDLAPKRLSSGLASPTRAP